MGLSVVAAFPSLMEAQIACGALCAAGFDAEVFDQNFGRVIPTDLIGGFRIMVPEDQDDAAKSFLAALARATALES